MYESIQCLLTKSFNVFLDKRHEVSIHSFLNASILFDLLKKKDYLRKLNTPMGLYETIYQVRIILAMYDASYLFVCLLVGGTTFRGGYMNRLFSNLPSSYFR